MTIIEPSATHLHNTEDPLGLIERAGRTALDQQVGEI
jgi:hypothetical protein